MNNDYSQPDFYRFNEDSIILVKWVVEHFSKAKSIVDLGAGCGVMGIELARELRPSELVLVELQNEFKSYLVQNCLEFVPKEVKYSIEMKSFDEFKTSNTFDLVVCNPPYYLPGHGQMAKNPNRSVARSFEVDSWNILIEKISSILADQGKSFLVFKSAKHLLELINAEVKLNGLGIKENQVGSLTILELFRLNKN